MLSRHPWQKLSLEALFLTQRFTMMGIWLGAWASLTMATGSGKSSRGDVVWDGPKGMDLMLCEWDTSKRIPSSKTSTNEERNEAKSVGRRISSTGIAHKFAGNARKTKSERLGGAILWSSMETTAKSHWRWLNRRFVLQEENWDKMWRPDRCGDS